MYVHKFFVAWLITVTAETLALIGLARKFSGGSASPSRVMVASIFGNALTLPYVWFVFPLVFSGQYSLSLLLSEIFAWLVEAAFYKFSLRLSWKMVVLFSLGANVLSYSLGYLIGHSL